MVFEIHYGDKEKIRQIPSIMIDTLEKAIDSAADNYEESLKLWERINGLREKLRGNMRLSYHDSESYKKHVERMELQRGRKA